jgi:hypothetical protein
VKIKATKLVTVQLEMTGEEAMWLAQLCVQVGGESDARRSFYHDLWNEVRQAVGEIPTSRGLFTWKNGKDATEGIYIAPADQVSRVDPGGEK